jgi:hypothetical protein
MDILALFQCLRPYVTATTLRQFSRITRALLVMTGRITMLGGEDETCKILARGRHVLRRLALQ